MRSAQTLRSACCRCRDNPQAPPARARHGRRSRCRPHRRTPRCGCPAATSARSPHAPPPPPPSPPATLQRLPRRLQQQPLLRIDRQRLARADPKKTRIKVLRLMQKAAPTHIALARSLRVRVVQRVHIPAPIRRELADRVAPTLQQIPQRLCRIRSARIPAAHPNNRYRLRPSHRASRVSAPPGYRQPAPTIAIGSPSALGPKAGLATTAVLSPTRSPCSRS